LDCLIMFIYTSIKNRNFDPCLTLSGIQIDEILE
jgi:hypothetical protein